MWTYNDYRYYAGLWKPPNANRQSTGRMKASKKDRGEKVLKSIKPTRKGCWL